MCFFIIFKIFTKNLKKMGQYKTKNMTLYCDHSGMTRSGNSKKEISLWIKGQGVKKIGTVFCDFADIVSEFKKQKKDIGTHKDFRIKTVSSFYSIYNQ